MAAAATASGDVAYTRDPLDVVEAPRKMCAPVAALVCWVPRAECFASLLLRAARASALGS